MPRELTIPAEPDAERALLGVLLLGDQDTAWDACADLAPRDLASERHQVIYTALLAARDAGEQSDLPSIVIALRKAGTLETAGSALYLASLRDDPGTARSAPAYVTAIRQAARKRRLQQLFTAGAAALSNGAGDVSGILAKIALEAADTPTTTVVTTPQRIGTLLETPDIDRQEHLRGRLGVGDRLAIIGPPKGGKSLLSRWLALSLATGRQFAGLPVDHAPIGTLLLTLEEQDQDVAYCLRRQIAGLDLDEASVRRAPLWNLSTTGFDLVTRAHELGTFCRREGIASVVVDTLRRAMSSTSGLKENDSEYGAALSSAVDTLRQAAGSPIGVTLLCHTRKSEGNTDIWASARGTGDLGALVDTAWALSGRIEDGANLHILRRHGSTPTPLHLTLEIDGAAWRLVAEAPEYHETVPETIHRLLLGNRSGLSYGELRDTLVAAGLSKRNAEAGIRTAVQAAQVKVEQDGHRKLYRLPEDTLHPTF